MAKAGRKPITWGLLSVAKAYVDRAYESRESADRHLTEWLVDGKLRWRSECLEGSKRDCDPGSGDPEFWREPPLTFPPPGPVPIIYWRSLVKTWDESWARRQWSNTDSYTFERIEVVMDDLAKLLPAGSIQASALGKNPVKPKDWLTAEVKRIKAAREIVPSGKTEFARSLEDRIKDAALRGEVTKPVGYRHIESLLGTLKLWPVPSV